MPRGLLAHWGERGAACPRGRAAIGTKAFSFPQEVGRIARRERVALPKGKGFDAHQEGQALRCFPVAFRNAVLPHGQSNPSYWHKMPLFLGETFHFLKEIGGRKSPCFKMPVSISKCRVPLRSPRPSGTRAVRISFSESLPSLCLVLGTPSQRAQSQFVK